jgi:hypothetical protein
LSSKALYRDFFFFIIKMFSSDEVTEFLFYFYFCNSFILLYTLCMLMCTTVFIQIVVFRDLIVTSLSTLDVNL